MISQFASDPALVLLLKLLVAYTTFVTRGKKDTENAIITRGDSSEMLADDAYFGSITLQAQELFDLLKVMPKLRNGGTRLLPRMVACIDKIVNSVR